MALIAKGLRGLFLGLFGTFTLFGISMTIVGAALPKILGDFKWGYVPTGAVLAASAGAYFLSSLFAGRLLDRIGSKATIITGLSACVAGLAFFASTPSILANFLLNALIGAGQGLIEPTVNWAALRMDQDSTSRPMNLMHGAFAIGAVAGPIFLVLILATGLSWTLLFRAISALFGLLGLILAVMPFSKLGSTVQDNRSGQAQARLRKKPAYWLGFASLLLYVGAELGISNWIAEYFVRIFSADPAFASLTVSLFWIGLLAGRFGVPALYRGKRQELVLVLSSLLLVAATTSLCVLGFAARGGRAALFVPAAITFLTGLGCSIIYPTVISLVGISCAEAQAEAISFAVAGGGVGLFSFPFIMSWISQGFGIKVGFASYALVAALTATSCAILARVFSRARMSA